MTLRSLSDAWTMVTTDPGQSQSPGWIARWSDVADVAHDPSTLNALFSASHLAVIGWDVDGRVTEWAGAASQLYGRSAADMIGEPLGLAWPDDGNESTTPLSTTGVQVCEHRRHPDGITFAAEISTSPVFEDGRVVGSVALVREVAEPSAEEQRRAATQNRFADAFAAAALPLVICGLDGAVVESNDAYRLLAGRVDPPAHGRFLDLIEPDHRPPIAAALGSIATDPGRFEGIEVPIAGSNNHILNLSIAPVSDGPDAPPLALVQLIDVSDQLRIQAELAEIATLDPLTQVFNRTCYEPLLDSFKDGAPVGLLFIDLDRFKDVNDTLGHAAGDIVLQNVATRLESVVRESDYVIRYGGDEFVIACPGLAEAGAAERLGDRLRASVSKPIDIGESDPVIVSVSIGVALVHAGPDLDPEAAASAADEAMYKAKATGRNSTVVAPLP